MHEMTIACNIVEIATGAAGNRPVRRITLEIGALAGILQDDIILCFDTAAEGTLLEDAQLEIINVQGRALCRDCGAIFKIPDFHTACFCGSFNHERLQGEELNVKSIELEKI
jgi:hydrogenase nickel incorporation protein HypA/HybF